MFAPPIAMDTLTPDNDRATQELAEYLRDVLNEDYFAIAHQLEAPILGDRPVVVGAIGWNSWSNNFNDFPLLCVYRRGSVGLDLCEATVNYYLPSMAIQDQLPGILRWVETRIMRALYRYSEDFKASVADLRHAQVLSEPLFRSNYGFLANQKEAAFPFVSIEFNFEEIGV